LPNRCEQAQAREDERAAHLARQKVSFICCFNSPRQGLGRAGSLSTSSGTPCAMRVSRSRTTTRSTGSMAAVTGKACGCPVFARFPRLKVRGMQAGGMLSGGERKTLALGRADEQAVSDDARDAPTPGLRRPDRRQKAFQVISVLKERRDLSDSNKTRAPRCRCRTTARCSRRASSRCRGRLTNVRIVPCLSKPIRPRQETHTARRVPRETCGLLHLGKGRD
jgi:hypothetical protein